jgi:glycine hydroxymethyltransferase
MARVRANAVALAEELVGRGYHLISGGTDNHLMLIDLTNKGVTGKAAEQALGAAHITLNKNMVPFDERSPFVTSGIRIGTPAITTRGMQPGEMATVADWIDRVITAPNDAAGIEAVGAEVHARMADLPLFAAG